MAEQVHGASQKLKSPEDVRMKRDHVLVKYQDFKAAAKLRRQRLEEARRFQQFKREADELESWVNDKLQMVSEELFKDRVNLQVPHDVAYSSTEEIHK